MSLLYFPKISAIITEIAEQTFTGNVENKSVLELGAFEGWFTAELIARNAAVTCIEKFPSAVAALKTTLPTATVIDDDFHTAVKTCGNFDTVVLYGVLYHSPAPLLLLEDIVNFVNPSTVLLETWKTWNDRDAIVHDELVNTGGYRQVDAAKTCGLAISISKQVYVKAMKNLGYSIKHEFNVFDSPVLSELVIARDFKVDGEYTIFTKD